MSAHALRAAMTKANAEHALVAFVPLADHAAAYRCRCGALINRTERGEPEYSARTGRRIGYAIKKIGPTLEEHIQDAVVRIYASAAVA